MRLLRYNHKGFKPFVIAFLWIIPILLFILCIGIGRIWFRPDRIVKLFYDAITSNEVDKYMYSVIFNIRLPRLIIALFVGIGLSVAGATYQSLFSNPLATPDILGVTAGACVGAVIAISLSLDMFTTQILAFVFGIFAVIITMSISKSSKTNSVVSIVLSGIIVTALFNAVMAIVKYMADPLDKLPNITYWLMGSFNGNSIQNILISAPVVLIATLFIYLKRWRLNILSLSEIEAYSLGVDVKKMRIYFIVLSTLITASCVSLCGQIGWVGLIVPHISRFIIGNNNKYLIPFSISIGASIMIIIDTISRSISTLEIPITVVTALVGAPIFILLLKNIRE